MIDQLTTTLLVTGIAYSALLITITAVIAIQVTKWNSRK
jgi:hypothetical protein